MRILSANSVDFFQKPLQVPLLFPLCCPCMTMTVSSCMTSFMLSLSYDRAQGAGLFSILSILFGKKNYEMSWSWKITSLPRVNLSLYWCWLIRRILGIKIAIELCISYCGHSQNIIFLNLIERCFQKWNRQELFNVYK